MKKKILEDLIGDVYSLKKMLPNHLRDKINYMNMEKTYSIVIKGKENFNQLRLYLDENEYSNFQTKEEHDFFTLVFQNNGFSDIDNILLYEDKNLQDKNVNLSSKDQEFLRNELKELSEINDKNKLIIVKQKQSIKELEDYISNVNTKQSNESDEEKIKYYHENLELKNLQLRTYQNKIEKLEKENKTLKESIPAPGFNKKILEDQYIHKNDFSNKLKTIVLKEKKLELILCMLGADQNILEENLVDYIMNYT